MQCKLAFDFVHSQIVYGNFVDDFCYSVNLIHIATEKMVPELTLISNTWTYYAVRTNQILKSCSYINLIYFVAATAGVQI